MSELPVTEGRRILADASISKIDDEAWLDIVQPGLLFRLRMTPDELKDLIEVATTVYGQLLSGEQPEGAKA